ncbi:MAG: 2-amino-4-hydroxy-6-hydroxymethyldihydropteridine diphosphokinase, partial [Spirochaetaceae bacterium]|nr:2-amino-4-hydroxy-6-hydroxymethyldihydropteridine diphosphokinase [Spirochaetaceae bacterium]
IIIKNLEVYGSQGYEAEVDKSGEKYIISAELKLNLKEAGDSDRLKNTVHLVSICKEIAQKFTENKYKLIESCAEDLATHILLKYAMINHVSLSIIKPWIPAGLSIDFAGIEIEREWHTVYLGIGSNMGNRSKNLESAIDLINQSELSRVSKRSAIYETEPFGYVDQDKFLNSVVEIKTLLTPKSLIRSLLEVEKKLKRNRVIHQGPRTIDLDILFYDNLITSFEEAVIPHPRLHERMFVLAPLCDIAPYHIHPILNERCYRIAETLKKEQDEPTLWSESKE